MRAVPPPPRSAAQTPPSLTQSTSQVSAAIQPTASSALLSLRTNSVTPLAPVSKQVKALADEKLLNWLAEDCRPMNIIEDKGLRNLLGVFGYTPPSRATLRSRLQESTESLIQGISAEIRSGACSALSLTTDGWSSDAKDSFVALTCHFITSSWVLRSMCIGVTVSNDRHIAEQITYDMERMLDRVGAGRLLISSVTRDNGANFKAGVNNFLEARRREPISPFNEKDDQLYESNPCFAHSCQLAVQHALEDNRAEEINDLIKKIHSLVAHIRRTDTLKRRLTELADADNLTRSTLVQSMPVRWSSTFRMLESVLYFRKQLGTMRGEAKTEYDAEFHKYTLKVQRLQGQESGHTLEPPPEPPMVAYCPSGTSPEWDMIEQTVAVLRLPAVIMRG